MLPWELKIRFYLFVILQFPSVCCTILILYYFKWHRLEYQTYGLLMIVNALIVIVELPITLHFLYEGTMHSDKICTSWITLNYSLFQLSITLIAWISIERYLLVYHEQVFMRHTILLHYGPIACIALYCPLFYIGIVVLHKCNPIYNVNLYLCGGACYEFEPVLGTIDWFGNGVCMVAVTFIVNVILIVRHLIQRHRIKRVIITADTNLQWNRSVKLSMLVLSTSMLHMITWIPYSTIVIIQIFQDTAQLEYIVSTFFVYLPYLQALPLPYLCLLFVPDIKQKFLILIALLRCEKVIPHQNRIQPANKK